MKKIVTLTALICGLLTTDYRLATAQNVGVGSATPTEKLDINGAVRVGTTSSTNAGTIRWNSPNFQGYDGTQWVNFGGGTLTGSGTATRVAFWDGTNSLSSNANLYWDNTNSRLGIGTATPSYTLQIYHTSTNQGAGFFRVDNSSNNGSAVFASTNGGGSSSAIYAVNNGWGRAANFEINNSASDRHAIYASTNGIGHTIRVDQAGSGGRALYLQTGSSSNNNPTLYSNTFGTGYAGEFRIDNSGSSSAALYASTSGTGPAIEAAGKLKSTTFQMTASPTVNYVLRSDASGNATWVDPNTLVTDNTDWNLTGNNGTVDGTNFIGTTDDVPLSFRVNNQKAGRIDNATGAKFNTFLGYQSGNVTTGTSNTAMGYQALTANIGGGANTAVGYRALRANTSGLNNTAVGYDALATATTALENTAVGFWALTGTTGNSNTAVGVNALKNNSTGSDNTAIGRYAGYDNATPANSNTTGTKNTFIGSNAGYLNSTQRDRAVAIGYNAKVDASNAMVLGGTGVDAVNVGIGTTTPGQTLDVNGKIQMRTGATTGYVPVSDANGTMTWTDPATLTTSYVDEIRDADNDTKIQVEESPDEDIIRFDAAGTQLYSMRKMAGGSPWLEVNSTNTLIGSTISTAINGSGTYNTAVGYQAAQNLTTGQKNTYYGDNAGGSNTTGHWNTMIGTVAGQFNDGGTTNTMVGGYAGRNNLTGSGNVFLGFGAGENETGSNKLYIDNSNTTSPLIQGDFSTNILILNGNVGIGTTAPGGPLQVNTSTSGRYAWYHAMGNFSVFNPETFVGEVRLGAAWGRPGLYSSAQLELQSGATGILFGNNNVEYMRMTAAGNVGIGTTAPTEKLDVLNGNLTVRTNANGTTAKIIISGARNGGNIGWNNTAGTGHSILEFINYDGGNSATFYTSGRIESANQPGSDDGDLRFYTSSDMVLQEVMRMDNTGNVGIGQEPTQKLDVNGKIRMRTGATTGYVPVSDANGTMTWTNPSSLTITETDPQVSSTTTNYIPKWNGTTLVDGVGYDNGTNVGIGTTAPDYKLHVSGSDYLTLKLVAPTNPLLKLSGSYNSGNGAEFWQDGTGDARLNINGTVNAIYMKSSGDVGIGMAFPTTPAARLDVNNGSSTVPIFVARDNGTEVMRIADGGNVGIGTTTPVNKLDIEGGMAVGATYSGTNTAPTNGAIIEGNVGIGTTSPSGPIHVNTSTAGRYMRYHDFGNLSLYNPNGSPAVELRLGEAWGRPGLSSSVQLELQSGATGILFGNNNVEYMRMTAAGNLGIGTTAPGAYLDITGTNGGTTSLQLRSGNTGVGTTSNQITMGFNGAETYRHAIKTRHSSSGAANNAIDFYVWKYGTDAAGTVGTEQVMTIDGGNGGSVGIGTTSPTAKLDVNGTVKATALAGAFDQSASGYTRIGNMQIAWGTTTLASGDAWTNAGDLSYVLASQSITFPANFNAIPTVTFSQVDGQIAARSAYITYHNPSTTGVSNIYLASPDPDHGNTTGVVVHWMAIGTWQ